MKHCLFGALLLACGVCWGTVPTPAQVRAAYQPSDARLLDRNGEPLQGLRLDMQSRRAPWVALDDISPALVAAVLQAEDQHFAEHSGVDFTALGKAAWESLFSGRVRGASTITMQLAALLDPALMPADGRRTLGQKWDQAAAAREIERGWTKRQVLEAYLNLVPFRGELRGIGAAAQGLFGKAPSGLDAGESAVLASLIRATSAPPKVVARRACALAAALRQDLACATVEVEAARALGRPAELRALSPVAPVAAALLKQAHGDVRSSIDGTLQRFAQEALRRQLAGLRERNVRDGAVVVLDNASGEVLAYVANTGDSQVDGVAALRQAGSTLKPFLYELALERRVLTAASLLDDAPIDIKTAGGLYVPQNYEKDFKGAVSVRTSLAGSLNVPAVKTLMLVGLDRFYQRLRDVGIDTLREDPDFYGYSLALGSGEVTLFELANAYRVLANGGLAGTPVLVPRGGEIRRRVAEEGASYIVADILSDRAARAITFGLDNDLATAYWSAVKTGTSKDMRDNWAVGFSRRFTVGVWVGNFDGEPMWDVSGVTGAAPVWRDVMDFLQRGLAAAAPPAPAGVERAAVTYEPAVEPPRQELFLAGTRQDVIRMVAAAERRPRIAYPADSAVLALDPDIPPGRERVTFSAQAGAGLRWQLDGKDLGDAAVPYPWTPAAGRHVLALVDARGREIAHAAFAVRGSRAAE